MSGNKERAAINTQHYANGQKVRLLKDIWSGAAEDECHPPKCYGKKGEILVVRDARAANLAVSHEDVVAQAFIVWTDEIEPV